MRFLRPIYFAGLCAIALAARAEPPAYAVRVRIPPEMDAENFRLGVGIYGQGLLTGDQPGEKGVAEYDVPCATSDIVKLFAYLPGYRIDHVDGLRAGDLWEPFFVPLDSVPLEGRLADSQDRPLPGETLVFTYFMIEAMPFFGYFDGGVPRLPLAAAQTRADGSFAVSIPALETDPFFAHPPSVDFPDRQRRLDIALSPAQSRFDSSWVLDPSQIPVQNAYAEPIVIRRIGKAALHGSLSTEFLRNHGIAGVVRGGPWPEEETGFRIELWANGGGGGYNCNLRSNLAFSVVLPPGRYDLQLNELQRGYLLRQSVPVRTNLVLEENGTLDLRIE